MESYLLQKITFCRNIKSEQEVYITYITFNFMLTFVSRDNIKVKLFIIHFSVLVRLFEVSSLFFVDYSARNTAFFES